MKVKAAQAVHGESPNKPQIETILTRNLPRDVALEIGELLVRTWPKPGVTVLERADKMQTDRGDTGAPDTIASRSYVMRIGERIVGHAMVFPRTISTTAGDMTIAALSSVCVEPTCRGQKLGEQLVATAWQVVDDGLLPFSLFQTSVRARNFYERFGCVLVENPVIDSTDDDPQQCPFRDDHIVRYPGAGREWPGGTIDLRGPGY